MYYVPAGVRACECACTRAFLILCGGGWVVYGRVDVCMCVRARAFSFIYPTWNAHVPYYVVLCGFSASTIFFDFVS